MSCLPKDDDGLEIEDDLENVIDETHNRSSEMGEDDVNRRN